METCKKCGAKAIWTIYWNMDLCADCADETYELARAREAADLENYHSTHCAARNMPERQ